MFKHGKNLLSLLMYNRLQIYQVMSSNCLFTYTNIANSSNEVKKVSGIDLSHV
jgi:hypothetical protein